MENRIFDTELSESGEKKAENTDTAKGQTKTGLPYIHTSSEVSDIVSLSAFYGIGETASFAEAFRKIREKGLGLKKAFECAVYISAFNKACENHKDENDIEDGMFRHPVEWVGKETRALGDRTFAALMKHLKKADERKKRAANQRAKHRQNKGKIWKILDNSKSSAKAMKFVLSKVAVYAFPAVAALIVIGSLRYQIARGVSVRVVCDGRELGCVSEYSELKKTVEAVERDVSSILGFNYKFEGDLRLRVDFGKKADLISTKELYDDLYAVSEKNIVYAYALSVNGNTVAANPDKGVLTAALERVRQSAEEKLGTGVELAGEIIFIQKYVSVNMIMSEDEVYGILIADKVRTSDVSKGLSDNITIAFDAAPVFNENFASSSGLARMENDLSNTYYIPVDAAERKSGALVSYKTTALETYNETVPYKTVYENDSELYEGITRLLQNGSLGLRNVTALVSYVDGKEVGRNVVSSYVMEEAVEKIILVGTKEKPPTYPTGMFILPVIDNTVTSRFGWRTIFGAVSYHYGIDFKASTGTTVYASDGGKVIATGNQGSYGLMVKIEHGDTYDTVYAHLSKILVNVGDEVYQGQPIAYSGATGRVTGPHLHFEIFVNGVRRNPELFLTNKTAEDIINPKKDEENDENEENENEEDH